MQYYCVAEEVTWQKSGIFAKEIGDLAVFIQPLLETHITPGRIRIINRALCNVQC